MRDMQSETSLGVSWRGIPDFHRKVIKHRKFQQGTQQPHLPSSHRTATLKMQFFPYKHMHTNNQNQQQYLKARQT